MVTQHGGLGVPLRPYQREAVDAIVAGLAGGGRGSLRAACGTGKTVIADHAARELVGPGGVVAVVVPSVALVAQILAAWTRSPGRDVLAVCGDETVTDGTGHASELACAVSLDVERIAGWLTGSGGGQRLVIATLQSVGVLGAGLRKAGVVADLLVVDEAHRTSGRSDKASAVVHDDIVVPAARRLYMTATPRVAAGSSDGSMLSMDDENVFGSVLYTYPFSRGIAEGWLDDYRVVVVGVTRADTLELLNDVDDRVTPAADPTAPPVRLAVAQAALCAVARRYDCRRVISFHPTVASAAEFARTLPRTLTRLDPQRRPVRPLFSAHVAGEMDMTTRVGILARLADPPDDGWTVISNARCLAEGVDVPAVDAVVFSHPKRSTVDVVQAVGRALRRNPVVRSVSTVVVPILLSDDEDVAEVDPGRYEVLWQTVRALRSHDDTLAGQLNRRRSAPAAHPRLPDRIIVITPSDRLTPGFLNHLTIRLVRETTSTWWENLAAARTFQAREGHLMVPHSHCEGAVTLGVWIANQRTLARRGELAAERRAALNDLGMTWNLYDERWERGIVAARLFHAREGHLLVSRGHREGDVGLGVWIANQRTHARQGDLAAERRAALDDLGMIWNVYDERWERGVAAARLFHAREGHLLVPTGHHEGEVALGAWLAIQRRRASRGIIAEERRAVLDGLGMAWNAQEEHWRRGLAAVTAYHAQEGHLRPPKGHREDGINLTGWLERRRKEYRNGTLQPARAAALEALGITWRPREQPSMPD